MTLKSKEAQLMFEQPLEQESPGQFDLGFDFLPDDADIEVEESVGESFDAQLFGDQSSDLDGIIEVGEGEDPIEAEWVTEDTLPGSDFKVDQEPEVSEEEIGVQDDALQVDENDAKKKKKKDPKWDWESKGPEGFVDWVKERFDGVPKHSGYDSAGLERALSYLERLDNEISRAMRLDLGGALDANSVEEIRETIEDGIDRLEDRLDKVKSKRKNKRKSGDIDFIGLRKEGQKITGVKGITVTVPLLISRIARVCINGMVSGGHDIEDLYKRQVKKFNLTDREQAETLQLLADMGYALRLDRGFLADEEIDPSSSDNYDWSANYRS